MITLRQWFQKFTAITKETPTHVVLGSKDSWGVQWDGVEAGVLLAFDGLSDAILDRSFDDGYGGNESPNLCAWSQSWVMFSTNYDGAESLRWVPRFPMAHQPIRPGGG